MISNANEQQQEMRDPFLWGASTSAHQVEGGSHNNWSRWEYDNAERLAREASSRWDPATQGRFMGMHDSKNYISGTAADHWNRYEQDFDLAKEGGHTAHRLSIDWARIEPRKGVFDTEAIAHYQDVVRALRARGLEPFVTLWHWTHPQWLEDEGGVLAPDFAMRFAHYAHMMVDALAQADLELTYIMTLNEPMSIITNQYWKGMWPHKRTGIRAVLTAYKNLSDAHTRAYRAIKIVTPSAQVGFTEILTSLVPSSKRSWIDRQIVRVARYWANERFIKMTNGLYDFLGVQYYFHHVIGIGGTQKVTSAHSDLGWSLHAEGLARVTREYAQYGVPLFITEDGLADAADEKRSQLLHDHIAQVMLVRNEGIDVRGYFHWSLLDNFEWDKGFWPRFGLIAVDYDTQKRTPRKSYEVYKEIIAEHTKAADHA